MDRLHLVANVHASVDGDDAVAAVMVVAEAVFVNAEHCHPRSDHECDAAKSLSHDHVVQLRPLVRLHGDVMIAPVAKRKTEAQRLIKSTKQAMI